METTINSYSKTPINNIIYSSKKKICTLYNKNIKLSYKLQNYVETTINSYCKTPINYIIYSSKKKLFRKKITNIIYFYILMSIIPKN